MTYRVSESIINVDGILMKENNGLWEPYIDCRVTSIQLENLYLFLHRESTSEKIKIGNQSSQFLATRKIICPEQARRGIN